MAITVQPSSLKTLDLCGLFDGKTGKIFFHRVNGTSIASCLFSAILNNLRRSSVRSCRNCI